MLEEAIDIYVSAWNERDPSIRRQLLDRSVADDCELVGPTGTFRGRDALEGLIVALQARLGEATVERLGGVDEYNRFRWAVKSGDGDTVLEGTDVIYPSADGRLLRIEVAAGGG